MRFVRNLVKGAVVAKVIQVAQRELSKPENQRKLKDGLSRATSAGGAEEAPAQRSCGRSPLAAPAAAGAA